MDLIEPDSREDPQVAQATILTAPYSMGDPQMTENAKKFSEVHYFQSQEGF